MPEPAEDLDDVVRRQDPDRWLASRFIPDRVRRDDVIALYAFNGELARIPSVVSQPMLGEIRLAWWREALDEIFEGRPVRRHPVTEALAESVGRRGLPRAPLEGMIDARERDLDPAPIEAADLEGYIAATAGALMMLSARVLDSAADAASTAPAALAWGLAGLHRSGRLAEDYPVRARVQAALAEAKPALHSLPADAFPAVAYAALSRAYAKGRTPGDLGKRITLLGAVLTGRV